MSGALAPAPAPAPPAAGAAPAPWVGIPVSTADQMGEDADAEAQPMGGRDAPASAFSALPWLGTTEDLARGIGAEAVGGGFGSLGRAAAPTLLGMGAGGAAAVGDDQTPVEPEQANAEGKPYGLTFHEPVPRMVLNSLVGAAQEDQQRAAVAAQVPAGLPSLIHAGASFAASLLDPVNVVAVFIPIGGEEIVGGALARAGIEAGEGLAGRTAVRAGAGALAGAVGTAPIAGVQAELHASEGQDASMSGALEEVLGGALLGGGLHPLAGGVVDAWRAAFGRIPVGRVAAADPEIRRGATNAALAAVLEDRPVQVDGLIELSARQREQALALRSLQYDASQPLTMRLNALEDDMTAPGTPPALADNLGEQHQRLSDIGAMRQEVAGIGAPDQPTQDRLGAIEDELTQPGPLTAARQGALLAEHRMLTEGAAPQSELEAARDEAQRQGNQVAIARNEARIAALQGEIRNSATVREALGGGDPEGVASDAKATNAVRDLPPPPAAGAPEAPPADMPDIERMAAQLAERRPELAPELEQTNAESQFHEQVAKAMESLGSCMGGSV